MLDLQAALEAKGWSDRQTGEEVLREWKRRDGLADLPSAASIAAKLGRLKKGDAVWWRNQHGALAALAHLLACRGEDLLPDDSATPRAIEFSEFPEVAPLLPGQEPCYVGAVGGWLGSLAEAALYQRRHTWIVAGPGAGKSLALRTLRWRLGAQVVATSTRRLSDAAREARARALLLVEIERKDDATDVAALAELADHDASVCVLAPFQHSSTLEPGSVWKRMTWRVHPDWRDRFTRWVQGRLDKPEKLDPEDIAGFLAVVDPSGTLFRTPGHLLPLLARAYRAGLPTGVNVLRDLGREALALAAGHEAPAWIRHVGAVAVEGLVRARLDNLGVPLGALSVTTWADLLPEKLAPATTLVEAPQQPRKGKRATARSEASVTVPPPLQAIHMLVDHGLLCSEEDGGFDVAPWIRIGIEREDIMKKIKSGAPEWTAWAVDATRKTAVDDALDAISPTELLRAIEWALGAKEGEFVTVAATEALFSAVGRRVLTTTWRPTAEMQPLLQDLGKAQLRLLAAVPTVGTVMPFVPITRNRPFDTAWQAQWLAEAWAFSFAVNPPKKLGRDAAWSLPGWARTLLLKEAPSELPWPSLDRSDDSPALRRLLGVARDAVRACKDEQPPEQIHGLLLPWVVIDGTARGWKLAQPARQRILHSVVGSLVGEFLEGEASDVRERATLVAWGAAVEECGGDPLYGLVRLESVAPALYRIALSDLPAAAFGAAFTPEVLKRPDIGKQLLALPARLVRAALPSFAQHARSGSGPISEAAAAVEQLGADDLDLLVEFVADKYNVGVVAAQRVWQLDEERALAEAREALRRGASNESYAWFHTASRERYGALLDALMEEHREVSWRTRWLAEVLPLAGKSAPRVFKMMALSIA